MFMTVIIVLFVLTLIVVLLNTIAGNRGSTHNSAENYLMDFAHGQPNLLMNCPHCSKVGFVRTKQEKHTHGLHGGKATAAILTGGVSLLATGLSKKAKVTVAFCESCKNSWQF
jgi:phage FluMu protein Com